MTIRSNPPGALVYIDNQEVGVTPMSVPFTYYGTREIRLEKDGFETLTVSENIKAPWYEKPGAEFISENLWPAEIKDEREFAFQLQPQQIVPTHELVSRAEQVRLERLRGNIPANIFRQTPPGQLPPPPQSQDWQQPQGAPQYILPNPGNALPPVQFQ